MSDLCGSSGSSGVELVELLLSPSVTGLILEDYVSRSEKYLALSEVASSTTAMNAVIASTTAMNAVMSTTVARQSLFNSSKAQKALRNSAVALAFFETIKTSLVGASTAASTYQQLTSRNCFLLRQSSSYLNSSRGSEHKRKSYRHILDGITNIEQIGDWTDPILLNRFMNELSMTIYPNTEASIRYADVVYFD